jgi:hypothetical protein
MIMLVQNGIFTAEALRTQRKHFALAGDAAKQKGFRPFKASLIIRCHSQQEVSIFVPKACLPAGRDGVFDPIAVSRLRGRSRCGAAKARLDQKKTPLSDLCGSAVSLIAFKPPQ